MRNPYEVLGVREGANAEEIKAAYKELVKKYHPDQYMNNPLSDLAQEKLKEINEAYDYLMKKAGQSSYRNEGGHNNNGSSASSEYTQARGYINRGNIAAAEDILQRVSVRDAEWYYLSGLIFVRKGWYNEAFNSLQTAVNMAPGNYEYRDALNRLSNSNRHYQSTVFNRRGYRNDPDMCQICQCLICTDCCCECAGGDFIDCC
ncbi:MAG: DnaJ domain-containing protein [Bacillota bacterium]